MYADHRFIRASRQCWGLSGWGLDEYAGVFGEIAARVDAAGGKAHIHKIVPNILSRFPDVAERSVQARCVCDPCQMSRDLPLFRR
jgi:hypothetical protein